MLRRDKIVLTAAVVVTVGAVLSRSHAHAGFYITLAGITFLVFSGLGKAVSAVLHYRKMPPLSRAWVALQAIEILIITDCIISGRIRYFPILLILAAEYFIFDSQRRR
ncbi:MAG: hypothetical protein LIO77_04290 [Rikenellaceae bacterium]|nr:hypothetical protein [Rikenellaceae bacterium]